MSGLLWCLQVVWVGLVFGVVFVVASGLIIGMYFDCRKRYTSESLKNLLRPTHTKDDNQAK